jgi:hypothetical protein
MNRDNCAPAIGVLEKMMTAFDADNFKPVFAQSTYKPPASDGWQGAHVLTAIRWKPTNSFDTGSSTSRQSLIASFILFIKTSKDLA